MSRVATKDRPIRLINQHVDATYLRQQGDMVVVRLPGGNIRLIERFETELPICPLEQAVNNHCWCCGDWQDGLPAGQICIDCQEAVDNDDE